MDTYNDLLIRPERRSGVDRRRNQIVIFNKYWLLGRRGTPRRSEDREKAYRTDRFRPGVLVPILGILMLSITDAALTLYLIDNGAAEINPVMDYFLNQGALEFFSIKYLLTCGAVLIVLVNQNMFLFGTRFRIKVLFGFFFLPFFLVVHWELFLIFFVLRV